MKAETVLITFYTGYNTNKSLIQFISFYLYKAAKLPLHFAGLVLCCNIDNTSRYQVLKKHYNYISKKYFRVKDRVTLLANKYLLITSISFIAGLSGIVLPLTLFKHHQSFNSGKWQLLLIIISGVLLWLGMLGINLSDKPLVNELFEKFHNVIEKKYFNNKDGPVADPGLGKKFVSVSNLCLLGSLLGFVFFYLFFVLQRSHKNDGSSEWKYIFLQLLAVLLILLSRSGHYLWSVGFGLKIPIEKFGNVISADRKIILYLRSFKEDSSMMAWNDAEFNIMNNFSTNVDVVGIGMPGEKVQKYGVKKIYFPKESEEWKNAVNELMAKASLIVVSFNSSAGLRWEINQILLNEALAKTLFYFPVIPIRDNVRLYQKLRHLFRYKYNINVPAMDAEDFGKPQVIAFSDINKPLILQPQGKHYEILQRTSFGYPISGTTIVNAKLGKYINLLNSKPGKEITNIYNSEISARLFFLAYIIIMLFFMILRKRMSIYYLYILVLPMLYPTIAALVRKMKKNA